VPAHQLRLQLRWSMDARFFIAPNLEWSPEKAWIDHANTLSAPGYTLVGLKLGGNIGARWSWFVDGRNLTDRRWIASTGVVANARGLDGRYLLPGDGRAVYAGLQWRLP
jgi:iron complex outermembrane receptor protein